ncbi:translocation/assembly module TamB domain-containing protein [Stappia sp. F7233]|uniref:Translocation/assembly module TamB domain-containing protein n=1 Tax=Stappia albiluteola TaxID=2758565 RepID=A0A839A9U7_9HYPH|nr:translocation/assembly module TamB domain-containing protein [Stappia albiluteola]MBA5775814.1 translocation/assembly module TamB domain-containing protein [Stappia albiluteola]
MRILRRLLKGTSIALLGIATLALALFASLQTDPGRNLLAAAINHFGSTPSAGITVRDVRIGWDLNASVGALALSDAGGVWLEADNLSVDWEPAALLNRMVRIKAVRLETLDVKRRPQPAPNEVESEASESGGITLIPLEVGELAIRDIILQTPVVGAPLQLTASGSFAMTKKPAAIDGSLAVTRTDGEAGSLSAEGRFLPQEGRLAFDLALEEPRGGLAARLLEIEDLPAIDFKLTGDGPLDNWAAQLALSLDGRQTVSGDARLASEADGYRLAASLDGELSPLAPPLMEAFLAGRTSLSLLADLDQAFAPKSGKLSLSTATLDLDAEGEGDLPSGRVSADVDLKLSAGDNALIALDLADRRVTIGDTTLKATLSGTLEAADWTLDLDARNPGTAEASLAALTLQASGKGASLDGADVKSPFDLALRATDIATRLEPLQPLDGNLDLTTTGRLDSSEMLVELGQTTLSLARERLTLSQARLTPDAVTANGAVSLPDLSRFAQIARQPLGGAVEGTFSLSGDPKALSVSGSADLSASALKTGVAQADRLLAGTTRLSAAGSYAPASGVAIERLGVTGTDLSLTANGNTDFETLDGMADLTLGALSRLDPRVKGSISATASLSGAINALAIKADITSDELELEGKALKDLEVSADLVADRSAPSADVELAGTMDGKPLVGSVKLKSEGDGFTADALSLAVGANRIDGNLLAQDITALPAGLTGNLKIDAPDLADIGPLLLTEISGSLKGTVSIAPENGIPVIRSDVDGEAIAAKGVTIGSARVQATVFDPLGELRAEGAVSAKDIASGGTTVETLALTAKNQGPRTDITLDARLAGSAGKDGISAAGAIVSGADRIDISLDALDGTWQGLKTGLAEPARIRVSGGSATFEAFSLQLGSGTVAVSGTAGETLDLNATVNAVPLAIANPFAGNLDLSGTASGRARATGAASNPAADWQIELASVSAAPLRSNGIPPLSVSSKGTLKGKTVDQTTVVSGPGGMQLTAAGTANLGSPISVDMTVKGRVPAEIAREKLTLSGLSGSGAAIVDARVNGPLTGLRFSGTVTPEGLQVTVLSSGLTVTDFTGNIAITNDGIELRQIRARLAGGGTLAASGTVGLTGGMPAAISVTLDDGHYMDGSTISAVLNAALDLTGPLADPARGARLAGSVSIERADINIPERLPGAISPVAVRHVNAPPRVARQVAALRRDEGDGAGGGGTAPIALDVTVSAPGKIFVRGRGLDAELGGTLRLVGTTNDPQAIGGFNLIRGRMRILSRTLDFSKGVVTFTGSLMPRIDFEATTTTSQASVVIAVRGEAEAPEVTLSSSPSLPQDEILANLLFDQSISNLSPGQIAQLAASVATLTGGRGGGPLGKLRESLGLDTIDVTDGGKDGPSVAVGKYINDNIYLGFTQGTSGASSRVTVDIDVSKNLKLRGEIGADGESKTGIFFEREY